MKNENFVRDGRPQPEFARPFVDRRDHQASTSFAAERIGTKALNPRANRGKTNHGHVLVWGRFKPEAISIHLY